MTDTALARIRAQMPVGEKLKFADYAIDATGEMEETIARAEAVASLRLGTRSLAALAPRNDSLPRVSEWILIRQVPVEHFL